MSKYLKELVVFLNKKEDYVSSQALADHFNVSTKTILNRIDQYNEELAEVGVYIEKKARKGVRLHINNVRAFDAFIQSTDDEMAKVFEEPTQRIESIIINLLLSKKPVSIEELTEKLFVGQSTIANDLIAIRKILAQDGLSLQNVRGQGYKIVGDELKYRRFLSKKMNNTDWFDFVLNQTKEIDYPKLKEQVKAILERHQFKMSYTNFQNICIHIVVMLNRLKNKEYYQLDLGDESIHPAVKAVTTDLIRLLEAENDLLVPDSECALLEIQFSTKRIVSDLEDPVLSAERLNLIHEMLKLVKQSFHVDLSNDSQLIQSLGVHLVPMEYRIVYDQQVENPLIDEIKGNIPFGFVIANEAVKVLERRYGKRVIEDEIALVAIHFYLAIQRNAQEHGTHKRRNLVIVCGSGIASSKLLERQVLDRFEGYIHKTQTTDVLRLANLDMSDVDLIVSTIPIDDDVGVPMVRVSHFLTDEDYKRLKHQIVMDQDSALAGLEAYVDERLFIPVLKEMNKEKIIRRLVDQVSQVEELPQALLESVLEREALFPTEMGNLLAIPHPLSQFATRTSLTVGILEKPILWETLEVQVVILIIVGKDDIDDLGQFYHVLSEYLVNEEMIQALIASPNYELFIQQLKAIVSQNKKN